MSLRKSNDGRGGTAATDTGTKYHARYRGVKTPRDRISEGNGKCQGMSGRRWDGSVDSNFSRNRIRLALCRPSAVCSSRGQAPLETFPTNLRSSRWRNVRAKDARPPPPDAGARRAIGRSETEAATSGARIGEGPTGVGWRYMGPTEIRGFTSGLAASLFLILSNRSQEQPRRIRWYGCGGGRTLGVGFLLLELVSRAPIPRRPIRVTCVGPSDVI